MKRGTYTHRVVREVVQEHLEILYTDVIRQGQVLRYKDLMSLVAPDIEERLRRILRRKWTLRPDYFLTTIRMISKHSSLQLAVCGDSVWRVEAAPDVTTTRDEIFAVLKRKRRKS